MTYKYLQGRVNGPNSLSMICHDIVPVGAGGIQWYVDQVLGSGHDKEEVYTNSQAKDAYQKYVSTLVFRTNTINGIQYKSDTTILSWELLVSAGPLHTLKVMLGAVVTRSSSVSLLHSMPLMPCF